MRFYDMNRIASNTSIHNKYMLTYVVAMRARQLSESRSCCPIEGMAEEKYISVSLAEMEAGMIRATATSEKSLVGTGHEQSVKVAD